MRTKDLVQQSVAAAYNKNMTIKNGLEEVLQGGDLVRRMTVL